MLRMLNNSISAVKRRSDCPVSFSLDNFGDKWTLLVLRDIMFYKRRRFSDFMPTERIASNILADRLAKLEAAGIIDKRRDPKLKNQYVYGATPKAQALLPLLIEMTLWGLEYDPGTLASEGFLGRVKAERSKVVREISRSIQRGKFVDYRSAEMGIKAV